MAIKARASTTLASIVDVQSTCRYYLLQSSSLATPSKPTTYPPPSSWGTTEPAYQEGSTNNLYFVDCTVFSDDTFVYSEVSLSSSYEAAKIAYNTALEAQESASDALDAANTNTEDLTNFQTTIETALDGLQGQIDGSIMTWFYEYVPTNENEPASEWTTTDLKNNHLGDLFYDTITGYCYRWQVQNNEYSWQRITDVDVTKALADAAKAQDTADDKRRVFVGMTSPTPPYDVGDLWAQGSTGELMKCKTAKSSGQSYVASDWEKASKYTDDTKAEEVQGNLDVVESTVSALSTDFNVEKGKISALITKTDSIETDITNIEGDISAVETNVSNLTTGQSQLTQTVNGITQNVSEIQSEQTTINNNISGLQTSVSNLSETTSTLETNLEGISATVSQHTSTLTTVNNDISDLEDRMDTAELKITPDAIIQTVSSVYETKEDASALADRVTAAETQITQNAEEIALRATKTEMEAADEETLAGAKSYADAQIQISADSITSTVSNTYATKGENEITAAAVDALDDTVNGKYEVVLDDEGNPVQAKDDSGNPVYDEEGNPVYEQIYTEGVKDSVENMEQLTAEIDDAVTRLDTDFGALEQQFSTIEQTVENVNINFGELGNDMKAWFDFSAAGVLEIGQSDSPVVSRQTNESYAFVEKSTGKELLRLDTEGATADTLNADQVRVGRENPQWAIRLGANGNLDDVWIGG